VNLLLPKVFSFFQHMQWSDIVLKENINTISYLRECDKSEGLNFIKFDFSDLINYFGEALLIKVSYKEGLNSCSIKLGAYDKHCVEEDVKDMLDIKGQIIIEMSIKKDKFVQKYLNVDSIISRYNLVTFSRSQAFVENLSEMNFVQLEIDIFKEGRKTIFIIFEEEVLLDNGFTLVIGGKSATEINNYIINKFYYSFDRDKFDKIIELRKELCHWIDGTHWLSPEHIFFDFDKQLSQYSSEIKDFLLRRTTDLIIPFLSNFTETHKEITFSNIKGYKKLDISYKFEKKYINEQVKYLFKIYEWVYSDKNADRISIVRNITTIFLCEDCNCSYYELFLRNARRIYKSVLDNFDIYLKDNVKQYFAERSKIRDLITSKCKEMSNEINSVIDTMNKSLITSAGIILAAIVGYVSKSNVIILKVSALVYMGFLIINAVYYLTYYRKRVGFIKYDFIERVAMFKNVLCEEEIPGYESTVVNQSEASFWKYWWSSLILNVIFLLATILAFFNIQWIANILK